MNHLTNGISIAALGVVATAQSHATIPAAHTNTDAARHLWLAGADHDMRH